MGDLPVLYVHAPVIDRLLSLAPRRCEVGGWLLGWWDAAREAIVVATATPPGRRGTPWGITISGAGHRRRFDAAWDATAGAVTFLGDWHSHPGGPAEPSRRDRRAATAIAGDTDFRTSRPLMGIVSVPRRHGRSLASPPREIRWYVGHCDGGVEELQAVRSEQMPAVVDRLPDWPWGQKRGVDGRQPRWQRHAGR